MTKDKKRFVKAAASMESLRDGFLLNNGIQIPNLGFGTWQMPNDETGIQSVRTALEVGYRHIDTAAGYENERAVGEGIRASGILREEIFVTTKLQNSVRGYHETHEAFAQSLKNLGLDYVDLYLVHWPNPYQYRDRWQEANADSWRAMEELCEMGKIRALGVSNFERHHLAALAEHWTRPPQVNQIYVCPGTVPKEQIEASFEYDLLIESYSPLGHGKVFAIPELEELAQELNRSVAQIVLRWHLQKGFLALPKSVTESYIRDNAALYDFTLSDEAMQRIDQLPKDLCGKAHDPDQVEW